MSNKKLTIGMMTFDDYHGVFFTIQAIRLYHADVFDQLEFLIIDNNPDSEHGKAVKHFATHQKQINYCEVRGKTGSVLKNLVFEMSNTEYTMCVDCHVLFVPGAIKKLLRFYEVFPECDDLLHGPLISDHGDVIATEMRPSFRGENFGIWHVDEKGKDADGDAYEISMQGMGQFACRTASWPRFAAGVRGFGSEEGMIHEKCRLMGRKAYCLPFLRWMHRFGRPDGVKYPITSQDKCRNLLLAFREVQLPLRLVSDYWKHRLLPGNKEQSEKQMSDLMFWAESLPPSPFPQRTGPPFLGQPIEMLD